MSRGLEFEAQGFKICEELQARVRFSISDLLHG